MREQYVDRETRSIADLTWFEAIDAYFLNRINVPAEHRGQGVGSRLLDRVLAEADKEGAAIVVTPSTYGRPGVDMDQARLWAWYERHGFEPWRGMLRREPREVDRDDLRD